MSAGTDSAGVPWQGRRFEPNAAAADDGSADPGLAEALRRFRASEVGQLAVVDALREARLLVPLVAVAGDDGVGAHGQRVDATQELSLVEVAGPDGRRVLPAFTSVDTMRAWNADARPVPIAARRVALAGGDGDGLVVLDPGSVGPFALRRSALRSLALGEPWVHPADDPRVAALVEGIADRDPRILAARALPGDPGAVLGGPELIIALVLADADAVSRAAILTEVADRWRRVAGELVDSLALSVVE